MTVTEKLHELGEAIKADPRHIAWTAAKERQEADEALQAEILKFNGVRDELMQANMSGERDEEKMAKLSDEMRSMYESIMNNEVMAEFGKAQEELNAMTGEINGLIQFYITGQEACGGSCSSCSGCGN